MPRMVVAAFCGVSCLCLVATVDAAETTMFIERGRAVLLREEGQTTTETDGYLRAAGMNNLLVGDRLIGLGDFDIGARLRVLKSRGSAASVAINGRSHFGFENSQGEMFVEGRFFVGRGAAQPVGRRADYFADNEPFLFEMSRRGSEITYSINGQVAHRMNYAGELGLVGLRPWRATMEVSEFWARGELLELPARTQPIDYTLPVIDLAEETERRVVVAQGTSEVYQGHPTTLLMPDGRTMFATWTYDHGGYCGPLKRSADGGLTWSDLIAVPDNWRQVRNCPALHRLTDRHGTARLFVLAGNGAMQQSVSEDEGRTWSPMQPNGLTCVVAPLTIEPISGGRHLALYHASVRQQGRSALALWQSISDDGGLTWSPGRVVATYPGGAPCEPAIIRSPDGRQLAVIARENTRRFNSLLMTSDDEGATWSSLVELPAAVTGDRHMPRYARDGRLVMTFRDMAPRSRSRGQFVGWVGTYDDLVNRREGQYRLRLLQHHGYDTGYAGLELLPDDTLVATTYCALAPGEKPSVVSVRFQLDELDRRLGGGTE